MSEQTLGLLRRGWRIAGVITALAIVAGAYAYAIWLLFSGWVVFR